MAVVFIGTLLADAWEWIAYKHVDDAGAAVAGVDDHGVGRFGADPADDAGFFAARGELEGVECDVGEFRGNDGDELTFVGDVKGIEAEEFAGAANLVTHGDLFFI